MKITKKIRLELLRHGPWHNQLISPLTRYIALCGDHQADTVTIPIEHQQLLARLRSLSYRDSAETRELQLDDTARLMTNVIEQVRGFAAELSCSCDGVSPTASEADLTGEHPATAMAATSLSHLELVLSAAELALLPFELAMVPRGVMCAGLPIVLQSHRPVCLTRRIRHVESKVPWSRPVKILMIAASPSDVPPIPRQEHVTAIVEALTPWTTSSDSSASGRRTYTQRYKAHLRLLPRASVTQIQEACSRENFTHVHILAHGATYQQAGETHYGIALHHSDDPTRSDVVSGERLAILLGIPQEESENAQSWPTVVTLASCDSGHVGSVIGAVPNVAHAMHEAGIPLVVASQFPLTVPGSINMVETLYRGFLGGEDPRLLLFRLRQSLRTKFKASHDWASIVAYAVFPDDLQVQLRQLRFIQFRGAIRAAFREYDAQTEDATRHGANESSRRESANGETNDIRHPIDPSMTRARLASAKRGLLSGLDSWPSAEAVAAYGLLAATEKREAELLLEDLGSWRRRPGTTERDSQESLRERQAAIREHLLRAREYYRSTYRRDRGKTWGLVQKLFIDALLERNTKLDEHDFREALAISTSDARRERSDDSTTRAWAYGNLIELCLLSLICPFTKGRIPEAQAAEWAIENAKQLVSVRDGDPWAITSAFRQVRRYSNWLIPLFDKPDHGVRKREHDKLTRTIKVAENVIDEIGTLFKNSLNRQADSSEVEQL